MKEREKKRERERGLPPVSLLPLAPGFKLFTSPCDISVDEGPAPLQMELVELQCNDKLS